MVYSFWFASLRWFSALVSVPGKRSQLVVLVQSYQSYQWGSAFTIGMVNLIQVICCVSVPGVVYRRLSLVLSACALHTGFLQLDCASLLSLLRFSSWRVYRLHYGTLGLCATLSRVVIFWRHDAYLKRQRGGRCISVPGSFLHNVDTFICMFMAYGGWA